MSPPSASRTKSDESDGNAPGSGQQGQGCGVETWRWAFSAFAPVRLPVSSLPWILADFCPADWHFKSRQRQLDPSIPQSVRRDVAQMVGDAQQGRALARRVHVPDLEAGNAASHRHALDDAKGDGAKHSSKGINKSAKPGVNSNVLLAVCAALVFCLAMYTPNLRWSGLKDLLTVPAEAAEGYAVADSHTCGSDDERISAVFRWARRNGARIHPNVTTGSFPIPGAVPPKSVRGLMAGGTIRHREIIFSVPPRLLLNIEKMDGHPRLSQVWRAVPELHKGMSGLAVLLLHEALNSSSILRPYLCTLPRHVPLPIFYSPKKFKRERAKWIQASQEPVFDDMVERARDIIEVHYVEVMPKLFTRFPEIFSPAEYTYARWAWACSIIMSRTWGRKVRDDVLQNITGQNLTQVHTLVPAADMPNHGVGTFGAFTPKDGSLVLRAHGNLSAGDQILISYGHKCDAEFLANYGFVPANNSRQECHARWWQVQADNMTAERLREEEGKMQQRLQKQVAWRGRWRGHFSRFYANLQTAQSLARSDPEKWIDKMRNLSAVSGGKGSIGNLFFKPVEERAAAEMPSAPDASLPVGAAPEAESAPDASAPRL